METIVDLFKDFIEFTCSTEVESELFQKLLGHLAYQEKLLNERGLEVKNLQDKLRKMGKKNANLHNELSKMKAQGR